MFRFSVIIPCYNLSKYIAGAVDSVIGQTIGFEENIQIIFVNDGSTDNTGEICMRYRDLYPDNIIYVEQENSGVSSARNRGMEYIEGEYVNFLDGDDSWAPDAFEKAYEMFTAAGDSIDVVSGRQFFTGLKSGPHMFDYKYNKGNRIVDINKYPGFLQMSVSSCFLRAGAVKTLRFDERLSHGEDSKFVITLIWEKCRLGIMRDAVYYITKREDLSSATQNKSSDKRAFIDMARYYYQYIYEYSYAKFGDFIPHAQYSLIHSLRSRLFMPVPEEAGMTEAECEEYMGIIYRLAACLDEKVICRAYKINIEKRLYMLGLKDREIMKNLTCRDGRLLYKGILMGNKYSRFKANITDIAKGLRKAFVSFTVTLPECIPPESVYVKLDGKSEKIQVKERRGARYSLDGKCTEYEYECRVKCRDFNALKIYADISGGEFDFRLDVSDRLSESYKINDRVELVKA